MRYWICFVAAVLMIHQSACDSFAVTGSEIKSAIESRFKITRPGFLGDYREIGSVLVVRGEGLKAGRPGRLFRPNLVMNRQLTAGGGNMPLGNNIDDVLKSGDRLYLYGVRSGEDFVELDLFTVRHFVVSGLRGPTPLQATIRFRYDSGLASVSARQIFDDIGPWLQVERQTVADVDAVPGVVDGKVEATPVVKTIRITGPQGSAGGSMEIHLGQAVAEVTAMLGEPDKKILLGAKTVFVYKDLKLIFVDSKLVDAY